MIGSWPRFNPQLQFKIFKGKSDLGSSIVKKQNLVCPIWLPLLFFSFIVKDIASIFKFDPIKLALTLNYSVRTLKTLHDPLEWFSSEFCVSDFRRFVLSSITNTCLTNIIFSWWSAFNFWLSNNWGSRWTALSSLTNTFFKNKFVLWNMISFCKSTIMPNYFQKFIFTFSSIGNQKHNF